MIIKEKDFTIEHDKHCFVLHLLKSKKELKEDSEDSYKVGGYFVLLENALHSAIIWRIGKKYPFKESYTELKDNYVNYKKHLTLLNNFISSINLPIITIKEHIFNEHRKLQGIN